MGSYFQIHDLMMMFRVSSEIWSYSSSSSLPICYSVSYFDDRSNGKSYVFICLRDHVINWIKFSICFLFWVCHDRQIFAWFVRVLYHRDTDYVIAYYYFKASVQRSVTEAIMSIDRYVTRRLMIPKLMKNIRNWVRDYCSLFEENVYPFSKRFHAKWFESHLWDGVTNWVFSTFI